MLELIKGSKQAVSNPWDFMTKQKVSNSLKSVGIAIKNLVSLADILLA